MAEIREIASEAEFDELILDSRVDKLMFIEFYGVICYTCSHMLPVLQRLADQYVDDVSFFKVCATDLPQIASRYEVMTLPTFISIYKGRMYGGMSGAKSVGQLTEYFDRFIEENPYDDAE